MPSSNAGTEFSSQPHPHITTFQLVYILRGCIEFEYEGHGAEFLAADSSVHQPTEIRRRELGHSHDSEMLEVVLPADFVTDEVALVNG